VEDALCCLRPFRDLSLADLSVSDDEFHDPDATGTARNSAQPAQLAAAELGIPCAKICIERPCIEKPGAAAPNDTARVGQPVAGGRVLFKGRAAEKLAHGLPTRPAAGMVTCPHEDLAFPERAHMDAYGHVHLCQGIGNGQHVDESSVGAGT
jgi:hypothetical protein